MAPLVDSVPEVAAGADAAGSMVDGLLEIEPEDVLLPGELEPGDVVLGVVVVLDDFALSLLLPHALNAAAAINANTRACFGMSVISEVMVDWKRSLDS